MAAKLVVLSFCLLLLQLLLIFPFKSRRKCAVATADYIRGGGGIGVGSVSVLILMTVLTVDSAGLKGALTGPVAVDQCRDERCIHGTCQNGTCVCERGWQGDRCEFCGGRLSLDSTTGYITDGPGNYSIDLQCTWLINSSLGRNGTVRLRLNHFVTECCWDFLYVFDGDSAFAPLLAAYSGLLSRTNGPISTTVPELVTSSGTAYLHFYSDAAYNMSGFNISYTVEACPSNCSGNGVCLDGVCTCNAMWTGSDCNIAICPRSCSGEKGSCDAEAHRCRCAPGHAGVDCSALERDGYWESVRVSQWPPPYGRASHASVVYNNAMWVFGGERFRKEKYCDIQRFEFKSQDWGSAVSPMGDRQPLRRYGHSAIVYLKYVYVYGGMVNDRNVTNELWRYDLDSNVWMPLQVEGAVACIAHTATKVDQQMIVFFGHSPVYGYLNYVQHYDILKGNWSVVKTKGALVKGGFGHTSVYDPQTRKIYVHGGYHADSSSSNDLSDVLYTYDPFTHLWKEKTPSRYSRYLHSATLINGLMLVYGGNTHNDTTTSHGSKCYSSQFLAYDIACDEWFSLENPSGSAVDFARYGHTAVAHDRSMYVFGGFNGQMLSSVIKFTTGHCDGDSASLCLKRRPGIKCVWSTSKGLCLPGNDPSLTLEAPPNDRRGAAEESCARRPTYESLGGRSDDTVDGDDSNTDGADGLGYYEGDDDLGCSIHLACPSCVQNGCTWCGGLCSLLGCQDEKQLLHNARGGSFSNHVSQHHAATQGVRDIRQCDRDPSLVCGQLHRCQACVREHGCTWSLAGDARCLPSPSGYIQSNRSQVCQPPCSHFGTCQNCTQAHCLWCSSEQRCVESNAYAPAFPYGQCRDWTTRPGKCPVTKCIEIQSCERCQQDVRCGWCDDGSGTGLGACMEGSARGPLTILVDGDGTDTFDALQLCSSDRWFFSTCTKCQCNGHSLCTVDGICDQPCENRTTGKFCHQCADGFYGDPTNGGICGECECNNHGTECNPDTGKCYCTTKGITGDTCDRCDEANTYFGNPLNGTCYYKLTIDYQFTFNLSKPEDSYYTQINFMNTPTKTDIDTDFTISCNVEAFINVTVKSASKSESILFGNQSCKNFKQRFPHTEYFFGTDDNTTFYVYVYGFKTPMLVQIAFSQYPKLDLLQFFITFSSCFLSLLVIAAILWKIKQRYDLYRRRQRLFVEMEQMASRPFSSVFLEMELKDPDESTVSPLDQLTNSNAAASKLKKKKNRPSPIALEPCYGNKAAVLSLVVRLPTDDDSCLTPNGQSGIAIASTLVTLGNPRKSSSDIQKGDGKGKVRKNFRHQHPDTCI